MIIVESNEEFDYLKKIILKTDSFWIPMYSDVYKHYTNNSISFIYFYCINEDLEYIVPFEHKDCIGLEIERLNELTSECDIYVLS